MNFVDYCIATRNYSTIAAIKDYVNVKTFAEKKSGKGAKIAAAALGTAAAASGAGNVLQYLKNKELQDSYDKVLDQGIKMTDKANLYKKMLEARQNKNLSKEEVDQLIKENGGDAENDPNYDVDAGPMNEEQLEVENLVNGSKKFSYYNNLINQYNSYKNRKRK